MPDHPPTPAVPQQPQPSPRERIETALADFVIAHDEEHLGPLHSPTDEHPCPHFKCLLCGAVLSEDDDARDGHHVGCPYIRVAEQLDAALATVKDALDEMEQVQGEMCDKCGWAMKLPSGPSGEFVCRCELEARIRELEGLHAMEVERLIAKEDVCAKQADCIRFVYSGLDAVLGEHTVAKNGIVKAFDMLVTKDAALAAANARIRDLEETQDLNVKTIERWQSKGREWKAERARLIEKADLALASRDKNTHLLRSLLARIHRDGGHYAIAVGLERASIEADRIILDDRQPLVDALAAYRERIVAQMQEMHDRLDCPEEYGACAIRACIRIARGDGA